MGSAPFKATQPAPEAESHLSEKTLLQSFSDVRISVPLSKDGALRLDHVDRWESAVAQSPKLKLSRSILSHSNLDETLLRREAVIATPHVFNLELDFKTGPITDQKDTGRCWVFASTNVLRYNVQKKLNLEELQLSQSYLFFWDKLNKANYYLELSIELAELPVDARLIQYLAKSLISDGGQWDMAVNLFELRAKKEELLKEVYVVLSATLGVAPKPDEAFTWDYYDKSGKAGSWTGTPKEFYKAFAYDNYPPAESFSLIHDPRNEYGKLYTINKLGNIWRARPVLYVNTQIDNLKQAVVRQIKAGHPVFFGCDVGKFSNDPLGIMDQELFEYEAAFDITFGLSKADRLRTLESQMTHAMVISGVHLDKEGNPVRYKVENSWGPNEGNKGYFVMSDRWFEEWLAPKDLVKVFEGEERVVLPAWDPMGALA
ncbi:peptidase C1B bleomycin hydrolase [Dichomitus squalens LYAD-421 SS1]|uniref:peptidase C1B bleomycin hydrolase n=1 Tax=Dichomitus squalens (strain LYAD-421) TaxID=732165 RepID=UPI0004412149|nr:peptidase C1B bleomycin hydrolase [Dichomitus squalens LYAD-421 SS1]EJF65279.1 peptidase C1B bleomycin hydrolase [Dichomitus squalens LYAD-421 SS1]